MFYNERERESPRTHCLHLFIIVFHTKSRNLLEAKQQKHFWFGCNRYIILHNQALQALQVHCFALTRAFTDYNQYDTLPRVSRIVIVTRYKLFSPSWNCGWNPPLSISFPSFALTPKLLFEEHYVFIQSFPISSHDYFPFCISIHRGLGRT